MSFICWAIESVFPTAHGLLWFIIAFGLCGWVPVCVPPAAIQLKWAGGEKLPGLFCALGALSGFGSHGNEFFGYVSFCTVKFINRHVHPPVMAINPRIWYRILSLWILIFWCKCIHSILFVKENQVLIFAKIGKFAILKYCLTGLPPAI